MNIQENHPAGAKPGARSLLALVALLVAATVAASWPLATRMGTDHPWGGPDTLQHIWVMRWYKTCLLQGRSPWLCPELQYPVGAPLGNFSPLHYQALLYLPLSTFVSENDLFCYNLIWMFGFFSTGFGTAALAWHVTKSRPAAALAGLLALWSTPVRLHGYGHLELVHVGWFPLFLLAWLRFVDRPTLGRMVAAASSYVLLAMSAAYFTVLAVVPAVFYALWSWAGQGRRGAWPWLRGRAGWMAGFATTAGLCLLVLFSGQVWAALHGLTMSRPKSEFDLYGAPLWGYVVPPPATRLAAFLPLDVYRAIGMMPTAGERASYLGVVTLFLLNYAAMRRVRFERSKFWWGLLILLIVLSLGSSVRLGERKVELPGAWLWRSFPPFRLIRVPARFNLLVAVVASVVAGAALADLLGRVKRPLARAALFLIFGAVAMADMVVVPFGLDHPPPMPGCYEAILAKSPGASFLEVPQDGSTGTYLAAATGYWQSVHGGRTTAGYSGIANAPFNDLVTWPSPFFTGRLGDPNYLADPAAATIDLVAAAPVDDYTRLYLMVHKFDYIVLHKWKRPASDPPAEIGRVAALLAPAKVFEDERTAVFESRRLGPPRGPVVLCTEGFRRRVGWHNRYSCSVGREARLAVYNPDPSRPLTIAIEAAAFRSPRTVTLRLGKVELARWRVEPGLESTHASPPITLPAGLQYLTLASDAEERPRHGREADFPEDLRPYSLHVVGVSLRPSTPAELAAAPPTAARR
ncbi:MAG TPA: hypothetical protein VG406_28060 [Isosphaeraceae bacterium]|jgi:hypothetical protein|nr:hypothetical protein [Isosphaeraceae bacterium]